MNGLTISVYGTPAPQGSKKAYVRGKRAVLVESSARVAPWRQAVTEAAVKRMIDTSAQTLLGPVQVTIIFYLRRPLHHYRTGKNSALLRKGAPEWPANKPDGDKLLRSTFDALSDAVVWRDDAQVVECSWAKKYTPANTPPGAVIEVWPMSA